jgi:hypothetical protein
VYIKQGVISHGDDILRGIRRASLANFLNFASAETKWRVRMAMVMLYVAGIAFSVGFFVSVALQ